MREPSGRYGRGARALREERQRGERRAREEVDPATAVMLHEHVLAGLTRVFGADSTPAVTARADLARAYRAAGHPERAAALYPRRP